MEEDYHKAPKVIFAYGYGCCMFKHNICGSQLEVLNNMPDSSDPLPPEFFTNPKCLPVSTVTEAAVVKANETSKDPKENASVDVQS